MATPKQKLGTGIDNALTLEAVYFSAPIPRNLAVLTVLGAVFDKVHFPGVHLPKEGFDVGALDKEIVRLEALTIPSRYDREILIGALKLTKHARTLEGFCNFAADPADVFAQKSPLPAGMVEAVYEGIHGPPRPGFIPLFDAGHAKGLPGSDETVIYPGAHHYIARALVYAGATGTPQLLTEKNNRNTSASRTRQKIANKGVHQSLIEWTRGKVETNGFILLIEAGLPEFTGEYLVTKYADRFPNDVVALARERLLMHKIEPAG